MHNNKDYYFSEESELYIYFQSGYWLFSRVKGSLSVVYYAVASVNCVHDVLDFNFYDWEFAEWIEGAGPVKCLTNNQVNLHVFIDVLSHITNKNTK